MSFSQDYWISYQLLRDNSSVVEKRSYVVTYFYWNIILNLIFRVSRVYVYITKEIAIAMTEKELVMKFSMTSARVVTFG